MLTISTTVIDCIQIITIIMTLHYPAEGIAKLVFILTLWCKYQEGPSIICTENQPTIYIIVYCHQCREWVTRAKYSKRSIQGVGCHWKKKCALCQTVGYNKRIDKGLCHVIWNRQAAILNEAIRSPTSSPIPFDMD